MFHSIVVPVDTTQAEAASGAIGLARDIAKVRGGSIILLNVVERVPGYVEAHIPRDIIANASTHANESLRRLAEEAGLPEATDVVIRSGHPAREILDYANEIGADLIVVASHDPGLSDFFLGSVAAHVVRHAHCSVLVARKLTD